MRYFRIFLLHFQYAFEQRSRSVVWFFIGFINTSLYLLFWRGAYASGSVKSEGMTISGLTTYYVLLIIAGAFLTIHIDEDIAYDDVKRGGLVKYLVRPFSYFWIKFIEELPWRIVQGFFGVLVLFFFLLELKIDITLVSNPINVVLACIIILLAYFLSFLFSMISGLSSLWIIEYGGLQQLIIVITLIFSGFVIPIEFFHPVRRSIALTLPFSYMIYFPVLAMQGRLIPEEMVRIIGIQALWLCTLYFVYTRIWINGIKRFTGVGQ